MRQSAEEGFHLFEKPRRQRVGRGEALEFSEERTDCFAQPGGGFHGHGDELIPLWGESFSPEAEDLTAPGPPGDAVLYLPVEGGDDDGAPQSRLNDVDGLAEKDVLS